MERKTAGCAGFHEESARLFAPTVTLTTFGSQTSWDIACESAPETTKAERCLSRISLSNCCRTTALFSEPKMAERKIGPFVVGRQIGVGGMGIVYSAIYPKNNKKVALKVLSPGLMQDARLLKRFEREIEILKRLDHPNIVKYYGGGTVKNQRYYAMEFIDGAPLDQVLKKRKRLSWEHAIQIGRQVSGALEHAHNAGIIHRDLKPANLFISRKGKVKLGDFGIARDTEATALTAAGKTLGTYAYMAPEQIQVSDPISRKTDLYALGCVLYQVIVGETPFQSDNPMDLLMQHLKDDPYNVTEKVPECPVWLDKLIERMLAKNPDDRPFDALAVHTELGEIRRRAEAGSSVSLAETVEATRLPTDAADAVATRQRKKKKKKKKKKDVPIQEQTWFLALCLAGLIGATTWLLWPKGEDWYAEQWRAALAADTDEYAQRQTLDDHLDKYLELFPEGRHVDEAREKSDQIHVYELESQIQTLGRLNKAIEPPFKDACVKAATQDKEDGLAFYTPWDGEKYTNAELTVNPLTAMLRWKKLVESGENIDPQTDEIRWLTRLAQDRHDWYKQALITSPQCVTYVHNYLQDALSAAEGQTSSRLEAACWYVLDELKNVDPLRDYVDFARLRYNGSNAPLPELTPAAAE